MAEPLRIMGIYAHPADVATEAAGTMAIHADRGDELTAVVLSDGIRMHPHFLTVGEGAASRGAGQPRGLRGVQARRGPPGGRDHRHREHRVHGLGPGLLRRDRRADRDAGAGHRPVPAGRDPDPLPGRAVPDRLERVRRDLRHPGDARGDDAHPAGRRRRAALHQGAVLLPDGPVDGHPLEHRHAGHRGRLLRRHDGRHRAQGPGLRPVREPGLRGPVRAQGRRGPRRPARDARRGLVRGAVPALAQRQLRRAADHASACSTAPMSPTTCRATSCSPATSRPPRRRRPTASVADQTARPGESR